MDPVVHFEMPFDTRRESDWNAGSNARYLRNGGIDRRALHPGDGKSITAWAGKEKAQDRLVLGRSVQRLGGGETL
jgi:hypothetical protein